MGKQRALDDGDGFQARRSKNVAADAIVPDNDTWQETLAVCELREKLTIRSYYTSLNTKHRCWDEPPSGASKVIEATEAMRKMANVQLQEMQVITGAIPDDGKKKKGRFKGLFRRSNSKVPEVEASTSESAAARGGGGGGTNGRIQYKPDSILHRLKKDSKKSKEHDPNLDPSLQQALASSLMANTNNSQDDNNGDLARALAMSLEETSTGAAAGEPSAESSSPPPNGNGQHHSPTGGPADGSIVHLELNYTDEEALAMDEKALAIARSSSLADQSDDEDVDEEEEDEDSKMEAEASSPMPGRSTEASPRSPQPPSIPAPAPVPAPSPTAASIPEPEPLPTKKELAKMTEKQLIEMALKESMKQAVAIDRTCSGVGVEESKSMDEEEELRVLLTPPVETSMSSIQEKPDAASAERKLPATSNPMACAISTMEAVGCALQMSSPQAAGSSTPPLSGESIQQHVIPSGTSHVAPLDDKPKSPVNQSTSRPSPRPPRSRSRSHSPKRPSPRSTSPKTPKSPPRRKLTREEATAAKEEHMLQQALKASLENNQNASLSLPSSPRSTQGSTQSNSVASQADKKREQRKRHERMLRKKEHQMIQQALHASIDEANKQPSINTNFQQ